MADNTNKTTQITGFYYGDNSNSWATGRPYSVKVQLPLDARSVLTSWNDLVTIGLASYPGMTFYINKKYYIISAVPTTAPSSWGELKSEHDAKTAGFEFLSIGEDTDTQYYFVGENGVSCSVAATPDGDDDENPGKYKVTISHDIGSVYTVCGSLSADNLNGLVDNITTSGLKIGDVYNVTDADGFYIFNPVEIKTKNETEDETEETEETEDPGNGDRGKKISGTYPGDKYVSKHYPAYTNVVWTDHGWDALGGTVVDVKTTKASASVVGTTGATILSIDVDGLVSLSNSSVTNQLSVSLNIDQLANEMLSVDNITVGGSNVDSGSADLSFASGTLSGSITVNVKDMTIAGGSDTALAESGSGLTGGIMVSIDSTGKPTVTNTLKADIDNIAPRWVWLCQDTSTPNTEVAFYAVD